MARRLAASCLFAFSGVICYCNSYEDSFNRIKDSTGLYVVNGASNSISQFAADPKSGILNELGTVAAGTTPVDIAVNSQGTFAYVVNSGSDDVYFYSIDQATRKLTKTGSIATGTTPVSIALHPTAALAFVSNSGSATISRYSIDTASGALTSLGAATGTNGGTTPGGIATMGTYFYTAITNANEAQTFSLNTSTGALTYSAPTAAPANPSRRVVLRGSASSHLVYMPIPVSNHIARLRNSTWATIEDTTATGTSPGDIAFNSSNTRAYTVNETAGTISTYSVSSGTLTGTGSISACTTPARIFVNPANFAYVVCQGDNKINAYSPSGDSLSLIASYSTGSSPRAAAGY